MEQYALTLALLLQVLQRHRQIYHIWATIPAETLAALKHKATRGTLCRVSLAVVDGTLASCKIIDQQEHLLLDGSQALACVWSCEQIVWSVQAQQETGVPEAPDSQVPSSQKSWASRPPARLTRTLSLIPLDALSRKQRMVLVLLDGRRTVHDLCSLLNLPTEPLELVLNELEALGLIT